MRRFVEGVDRGQTTLCPERLEDWIGEDHPVRGIDAFVDALDLRALGLDGVVPEATGRPSDHPPVLLKLYIDGSLNRVPSSRRLEREASRNVELMGLTGRRITRRLPTSARPIAAPSGRSAPSLIRCRQRGLLTTASVAIDGSKFKAVNTRDRNATRAKVERRRAQSEESVARHLQQLDPADRPEPAEALAARSTRLKEKIAKLGQERQRLAELEAPMRASPDPQISLTDPEARSRATSGRGAGVVGDNGQIAGETQPPLIGAHEVTNDGCDRARLSTMGQQATAALEVDQREAVADRGDWDSEEILACDQADIAVPWPKPMPSGAKSKGHFGQQAFVSLPEADAYRCPAGERLRDDYSTVEWGLTLRRSWTTACHTCPLKSRGPTATERRLVRWEHEEVPEAVQRRLALTPGAMRQRREVVEPPFGPIKLRMGATPVLMKTLPKVAREMALHGLAYNLTRVLNSLGLPPLLAALRA